MKVSLGKVVANKRNSTLSMFESNSETELLEVAKKNIPEKGSEMLCLESQSNRDRRQEL